MGKLTHEDLYDLDWKKILRNAIDNRPTSWCTMPVREWRNASDELCLAVIRDMEEKGLITENKIFYFEKGEK